MNHSDALALIDLAPAAKLALLALALAALPWSWLWLRQRGQGLPLRLAALTALTLFLTFDLIVFGAFTRLSDSGLGCPDWPGCYGQATPVGARADIQAAQTAAPGGPVTWSKAWIEMIHRYLAMTVGVLILVMAAASWRARRGLPFSPWLPTFTLLWVLVQGLFGKYTVTLKLYPAVVTLHLLGGLFLLALLAAQHVAFRPQPVKLPMKLRWLLTGSMVLLFVQVTLGGWVSTNYAVLACTGFPMCNGQWWPEMDWRGGFTVLRGLGESGPNGAKTLSTLVAIHMAHRLGAIVLCTVLLTLAWRLWGQRKVDLAAGRFGLGILVLVLLQVASGLSNVVLGWPLVAALGHSAGAAGLVLSLTMLWARARRSGDSLALPGSERLLPA